MDHCASKRRRTGKTRLGMTTRSRGLRQRNKEPASLARFRLRPNLTALLFDERLRKVKAQSRTRNVTVAGQPLEGQEDPIQVFRADAGPVIGNGNHGLAVARCASTAMRPGRLSMNLIALDRIL